MDADIKTASDSDPQPGLNPKDSDTTPPVQDANAPKVLDKPWPGKIDADTITQIRAVTAVKAGPNVLVATDNTGKLPVGIIPTLPASYVGPTHQSDVTASRASGTVYHNTTGFAMWVYIVNNSGGGGNSFYSDASATPTTVIAEANQNTNYPSGVSIMAVVIPGNYYKYGSSFSHWIETY